MAHRNRQHIRTQSPKVNCKGTGFSLLHTDSLFSSLLMQVRYFVYSKDRCLKGVTTFRTPDLSLLWPCRIRLLANLFPSQQLFKRRYELVKAGGSMIFQPCYSLLLAFIIFHRARLETYNHISKRLEYCWQSTSFLTTEIVRSIPAALRKRSFPPSSN